MSLFLRSCLLGLSLGLAITAVCLRDPFVAGVTLIVATLLIVVALLIGRRP